MTRSNHFLSHLLVSSRDSLTRVLFGAIIGLIVTDLGAVVWRPDLTDQEVQDLAKQGQFAGVGRILVGGTSGTGAAIAPGWVITAKHVVGNGNTVSFILDGQTYQGTSVGDPGSDIALVRLNANAQLPGNTPFITPNPGHNAIGPLVWKVGWGQAGPIGGPLTPSGVAARAGTNVYNSAATLPNGPSLLFNNSSTTPNSTLFEVSTAPGDSGGPTFLQHNKQWFITGTVDGFISGTGNFTDADVSSRYSWIVDQTGDIFIPQAAPTELTWDGRFDIPGVQTGPGQWHRQRPMFEADGYNYTWENDTNPVAVFGTPTTGASIITVQDDIVFSEIRFAETQAGSGPFQILDGEGTLRASSGGGTLNAQQFARIGASIRGSETITKTGSADLIVNGDNTDFTGQFFVAEGTMILNQAEALGTGGFTASTKTTVNDGATLQLRGPGIETAEHFHIYGNGEAFGPDDGDGTRTGTKGALYVSAGNHTLGERIALRSDAMILVDGNTSITIGGAQGRFYNPFTLTQTGPGTVVFDRPTGIGQNDPGLSNIGGLVVVNGITAGNGGINGTLSLTNGSELRPGDSATAAEIGTFTSTDFMLDMNSMVTIDWDPTSGLGDQLMINGSVQLAGTLNLNLLGVPMVGDTLTIFNNDALDSVGGQFSNGNALTTMFGGETYAFSVLYDGGTGNDIVLRAISAVPEPGTTVLLGLVGLAALVKRRKRGT